MLQMTITASQVYTYVNYFIYKYSEMTDKRI